MMKMFLLPYRFKLVGWILVIAALILTGFYMWFDFNLKMPVFALISSFLETRMLVTFRTNVADELIMLLFIIGMGMAVGSKERIETEAIVKVRAAAMIKALFTNSILLLISVLFVYGSVFITILVLNLVSFQVFYLLFFYNIKRKARE
jgi:hypothetical protein